MGFSRILGAGCWANYQSFLFRTNHWTELFLPLFLAKSPDLATFPNVYTNSCCKLQCCWWSFIIFSIVEQYNDTHIQCWIYALKYLLLCLRENFWNENTMYGKTKLCCMIQHLTFFLSLITRNKRNVHGIYINDQIVRINSQGKL